MFDGAVAEAIIGVVIVADFVAMTEATVESGTIIEFVARETGATELARTIDFNVKGGFWLNIEKRSDKDGGMGRSRRNG